MAGVNDPAFRIMCHNYGCSLVFTEMVSVNAAVRNNKATLSLARVYDEEKPIALQLFGTKIEFIKKSIKLLEDNPDTKPNIFDFNFGCPADKIISQGAGSALLKRPAKIGEIISAMRASTDLPVSAKIRLGVTPNTANYLKTAKIIEEAGADMLIVHGRYQSQGYAGKADWNAIKEIKESVDIPVVSNGDVFDEKSAEQMIEQTKCDYIMIGRGAIGNPFIFSRVNSYLQSKKIIPQKDKISLFEEYLKLTEKYPVKETTMREQAMYFTKGMQNSAKLRDLIRQKKEIPKIIEMFKNNFQKD
jgi:tRNA-dihydrouridine synthase B